MAGLRKLSMAGIIIVFLGGYAWLGHSLDISVVDQIQSPAAEQPLDPQRPVQAGLSGFQISAPLAVVPVFLNDGRVRTTIYTRQSTVEAVLREQGLQIFAEDHVAPQRATVVRAGLEIYLNRATAVTLVVDGRVWDGRTQQQTVGAVLAERGIALMGQDYSRPALDQPVTTPTQINVVRVREVVEIVEDITPFETNLVADDKLEIDRQEVRQPGATGVVKTRIRVRYENGVEVQRVIEDEWVAQETQDRVIAYGSNIVVRTLDTPEGTIEYWRKIPMLATAYNADTAGKDADHPRYGVTRSGLPAGYGHVAVDPTVIPLLTDLYVIDYGPALAADTGGQVKGKRIDLGFDVGQALPVLLQWRDVYMLTPVPPADQIRYVLPQWPQR